MRTTPSTTFWRTIFACLSLLFAVNAGIRFSDGRLSGAVLCTIASLGFLFVALTYRARWTPR